jgi:hypothetical protein
MTGPGKSAKSARPRAAGHRAPPPQRQRQRAAAAPALPATLNLRRRAGAVGAALRRWGSLDAVAAIRRRWRWVAPLAAAGAAALAVVVYVATEGTGAETGGSPGTAASSGGAASPSPGPVTVHHAALRKTPEEVVASLHLPPGLAAALTKWDAGRGGTELADVSSQVGAATQASGLRLYAPMRHACLSLSAAVSAARAGPPIPSPVRQAAYSRALAKLASAASVCQAGISLYPTEDQGLQAREDPAAVRQADGELATGARDLYQATVDISALHRR